MTAGGSVTTDVESDGTNPADPLELEVTSPNAGIVEVLRFMQGQSVSMGFELLGIAMTVTAPEASVADPLVLAFAIDASLLPADPSTVRILRDGVPVPDCTGAPQAVPDPCESMRANLPGGSLRITVLTSSVAASGMSTAAVRSGAQTPAVWSVGVAVRGAEPAPSLSPWGLAAALLVLSATARRKLRRRQAG